MLQNRLLTYAQHRVHPHVRSWLDEATITANLSEEVGEALERLQSDALAEQFAAYCELAGTEPDDYKNRLLEIEGVELLTGIRFLGGDLSQPFVEVIYHSEPALTSKQVAPINDALRQEFAVFRPKRTRFYLPSHQPRFSENGDKRLIAAPLAVMLKTQPEQLSRVKVQRATSLELYPRYAALYEQLHAERPELREVASAESEEDMGAYLDEGHLFEIFVDGQWAGVTAVFSGVDAGLGGLCVAEVVLDEAFRGVGLRSAVQVGLASALTEGGAPQRKILFGTIGQVNVRARRAALRAGRVDLGGHVWLPLDPYYSGRHGH